MRENGGWIWRGVVATALLTAFSFISVAQKVVVWESEGYGLGAVKDRVEQLTGLQLEVRDFPYGELRSKLETTLLTGDPGVAPDIVMVDSIWLGELVSGGYLADLTQAVAGVAKDWYPAFRNGSQWPPASGKYYGLWYDTDVRLTFYWPGLLQKAGVNPGDLLYWDTYITACKNLKAALKDQGIGGCWLDMAGGWAPDFEFFPYLWQEGGKILEKRDGKYVPAFQSEAGVRALQFLVDRVKAGIDPQTQTFWGNDFAQKKWAVYPHGNWAASESRFPKTTARERQQRIAALPLPVSAPGKVPVTLAGGWIMSVPAVLQSKAPDRFDRAVKVMQAFLRSDVMTDYYGALARVPVRAGVDRKTLSQKIEFFDFYTKLASVARVRPAIPQWSQVSDAIFQAMGDAVFKGVDPKVALEKAAEQVRQILAH